MRGTKSWSKEEQREMIDEQKQSGLSVAKYCKKRGIPNSTFFTWIKKCQQKIARVNKNKGFVKIESTRVNSDTTIEINTPKGYRIEIPSKAGLGFIERIIHAVIVR